MSEVDHLRAALHESLSHPLSEAGIAEAMLEGGRIRRRHRLRRAGTWILAGAASMALVIALGAVVLGNAGNPPGSPSTALTSPQLSSGSRPKATTGTAGIALVSYLGAQPQGYEVEWVPRGWVIQGGDPTALTIAPSTMKDKHYMYFVGKLAVLSASTGAAVATGTPQPVDGRPGYVDKSKYGLTLEYKAATGRWVVIQAPLSLGWDGAQIAKFAAGVKVLSTARDGHG